MHFSMIRESRFEAKTIRMKNVDRCAGVEMGRDWERGFQLRVNRVLQCIE